MKLTITLIAAFIGGIALPTLVMAGPTENITGCATAQADNSNFTVRVDPTCDLGSNEGSGLNSLFASTAVAALGSLLDDEEGDE